MFIACSVQMCCKLRTLWMRLQIGVCETSLSDVMAPEVHQTITLCQWTYFRFTAQVFSMVDVVTQCTLKKHIPVKIERWAHAWGWAFARDNTLIRAVIRLSQSKAVTWFTGPHAVRICMNLKTVLAASKHKSCMWKHSEVSHPLLNWTSWNRQTLWSMSRVQSNWLCIEKLAITE